MTPRRKVRVLVADDHPDHVEAIVRILLEHPRAAELEMVPAADGVAADEAMKAGVDLAFLDIRMPGFSGFEVAERARSREAGGRVPIVFVTSSTDPKDREAARSVGASGYVVKARLDPFREALLAALDAALRGKPI